MMLVNVFVIPGRSIDHRHHNNNNDDDDNGCSTVCHGAIK